MLEQVLGIYKHEKRQVSPIKDKQFSQIITTRNCVSDLVLLCTINTHISPQLRPNFCLPMIFFDALSKVVVASVIFVVIWVITDVSIVVPFFIVVGLFIIRL